MHVTTSLLRKLCLTAVAAGAVSGFAVIAQAGECPADKVKDGAVTGGESKPVGVTDTVLASIDLSPKGGDFKDQTLRMRRLVIAPGGVVPWHEHSERPANILVVSGTIEEYRANCEVPIVHKTGDVASEFGTGFAHWWKNTSAEPVELISADILKTEMKSDKTM
jgi:quercetin dioxygenase-like cupin family protein